MTGFHLEFEFRDGHRETVKGDEAELERLRDFVFDTFQHDPRGLVRMFLSSGELVVRAEDVASVGVVEKE